MAVLTITMATLTLHRHRMEPYTCYTLTYYTLTYYTLTGWSPILAIPLCTKALYRMEPSDVLLHETSTPAASKVRSNASIAPGWGLGWGLGLGLG